MSQRSFSECTKIAKILADNEQMLDAMGPKYYGHYFSWRGNTRSSITSIEIWRADVNDNLCYYDVVYDIKLHGKISSLGIKMRIDKYVDDLIKYLDAKDTK